MNDHDDDEWDDKKDLTRLEDLSEFLHQDDPDVEEKLKQASGWMNESEDEAAGEDLLAELPDLPPSELEDEDSFEIEEQNVEAEKSQVFDLGDLSDLEEDQDENDNEDNFSSFGEDSDNFSGSESDSEDESPSLADEDNAFNEETDFSSSSFDFDNNEDNEEDEDDNEDDYASFGQENDSFTEDDTPTQPDFALPDEFNSTDSEELQENLFESNEDGLDDIEENEDISEDKVDNNFDDTDDTDDFNSSYQDETLEEDQAQETEHNSFDLNNSDHLSSNQSSQVPSTTYSSEREDFQELRDFGNAITYGLVKTGGNPPYTLILRNIKYEEDAQDILILLREHGLVTDENESITEQGLQNGHLLISQISEYSAIYLAHKMRRFHVQIRLGLSEQLHPTKSYTHDNKGLVSKYNLRQDRREAMEMERSMVDIEDILISTTTSLDGYDVVQYMKVLSAHYLISQYELENLHKNSRPADNQEDNPKYAFDNFHQTLQATHLEQSSDTSPENEDENILQQYNLGLEDIYSELADDLRNQAFKIEANAIVGLNYSISPIMLTPKHGDSAQMHYKITCTGNAVWISDRA